MCFFPIWTWMALIYYDFPIEHCHFTGVSWWYQTLLIRRGPFGKGFETWGSCRLRDSNDTQFSVGLEMVRGFFFCKLHGNLKFIFYHMGRFFAGQSSLGTSFYMEMWMMFSMFFQCIRGRWTNYYMYIYMEKILKWYPKSSKCRIYFSLETYWNPWWLGSAPFQRDGFLVTPRFASLSQQLLECALDSQGRDSPETGDKKTWTAMAISYNWLFQWDYIFYKWGYKYL